MRIGLYFGSFNPIHVGHLIIAQHIIQHSKVQEIWFMVSPHNPHKEKNSLANMYDRLEMVNLAIEKSEHFKASDFEFKLPQPSFTIDTLSHLKERYPGYEFQLIMGGDNLATLHKWKNYELILRDYSILVYPRPGANLGAFENHPSIQVLHHTPLMEISSTYIRKLIQKRKEIKYLVPDSVMKFIESKGLYEM